MLKNKFRTKTEELVNENIALVNDVDEEELQLPVVELQLPVVDTQVIRKYNEISVETVSLINVFFE